MNVFQRIKRYSPGVAVYLFAGVFLLRAFVLARLTTSPFLLASRGDMYFYNDWAQRILRGQWTDHLAFYGLPLYAYLLAFFYKIFGYSPFVPGLLQAMLEGGTAVLIYQMTVIIQPPLRADAVRIWRLDERQIFGLLAAAGWAFFVPAQAYSAVLMPTAWLVFIFWLLVWRALRTEQALSLREYSLTGLLIGVTAMGVATILFLVPLVLATALRRDQPGRSIAPRRLAFAVGLLLFGIAAGSSPCWIHNYFVARDPVFLSAHSGINFWIGNNPAANGYPRFPPGLRAGQAAMLQDSITSAERAAGRPLKRSEVSAYWSAQAKTYVVSHPLAWLKLLCVKFRNFWSAFRYDDLSIISGLRASAVILPGISFGLVAALAIPGILLAGWFVPRSRLIAAAIFLHMAALLPVFVTERYRLPVVPGLLVFTSIGLSFLWHAVINRAIGRTLLYLSVLLLATTAVSWPQQNPSLWALDAYNSGWQALESGDLKRAEETLLLAYAYVPTNAETNFALGNLRLAQNNPGAASKFYLTTLAFDPRHEGAFNNLGVISLQSGKPLEAARWFQRALSLNPRNAKSHFLLAKALSLGGDQPGARTEVEQALFLNPEQPEFRAFRETLP